MSSKWRYTYTAGWQVQVATHEVKEQSPELLRRQWAECQGHVGAWLQLYQIHSATLESGVLEKALVLDALAVTRDGGKLFDAVQATWNPLSPPPATPWPRPGRGHLAQGSVTMSDKTNYRANVLA